MFLGLSEQNNNSASFGNCCSECPFPPEPQRHPSLPEGRGWGCSSLYLHMMLWINSCAPVDRSKGARLVWHPWVPQNSHDPQHQTGKDWSKSSTDKSSSDLLWPRSASDYTADFVPVKTCGKWDFLYQANSINLRQIIPRMAQSRSCSCTIVFLTLWSSSITY